MDALFAAESVQGGGIPIVEVTVTMPGALKVLPARANSDCDLDVGAGSSSWLAASALSSDRIAAPKR